MKWRLTTYQLLAVTAVVLVATGATMAIGTPREVFEPTLGQDWQCGRTLLVVTTCSHSNVRPG
ncbi:hypothetical protein ACVWW4_004941 [Bradyrhizobium sp. LB7.1]